MTVSTLTWHTGTGEGLTEEAMDAKVLEALRYTPLPAVHLSNQVELAPAIMRESLLRLQRKGLAEIEYGFGWRKR